MLAGFLICLVVGLLIIFLGYQIHVKKRLFLLAGYQEEMFIGDKNKLAKLSGVFSYIVGVATIILPFGLEKIGDVVGAVYAVLVVLGTIVFLIKVSLLNKSTTK
ncbi:DUF3784 domain-containing protein [Bacillus cereus]|uniref:DUF3784 domain-containing protein n=1 Tax=Bacillus paramycoides TaxID=2026194 RepID=A0A1J9U4Q4_9BACI|nr:MULTISPECIES: DUF3784 domain-containing protein [Bacillus cereus group]PFD38713.1 DUF3784 domain-containing protein [Bacillus cereus]MCW9130163.1 DUF3784 domain-containing protein [Bacillus paramycoides]MED0962492.1 DUF3784 domain-containing protein [Bacillus paramycoides]MED0964667.1 DUF3784 domain-containing protein [Bacillus paramycoides]MED1555557.1 DUF3784 domain-containing protein [Bacillus paramycoides]